MQNPPSPPKFRRSCPTCNRPVEPGYKFCETCGTRIPELSTCSKCGTGYDRSGKLLRVVRSPDYPGRSTGHVDDSPEHSEEENTGGVEDQTSDRDEQEIPEPDTDELPEDNDEENIVTCRG